MSRKLCCVFLATAVGCVGGPQPHGFEWVAGYRPGEPARERGAPRCAVYGLYRDAEGATEPLAVTPLKPGDRVGFRTAGGRPVAVAGAEEVRLGEGKYSWRVVPDRDPDQDRAMETLGNFLAKAALVACVFPFYALYGIAQSPSLATK